MGRPLRVSITIYFPRPKSHFKTGRNANIMRDNAPVWHTSKPDRDNCDKAIMDALTNLGFGRTIPRHVTVELGSSTRAEALNLTGRKLKSRRLGNR